MQAWIVSRSNRVDTLLGEDVLKVNVPAFVEDNAVICISGRAFRWRYGASGGVAALHRACGSTSPL